MPQNLDENVAMESNKSPELQENAAESTPYPDRTAEITNLAQRNQQNVALDRVDSYRILLGAGIMGELVTRLGTERANQFLDFHVLFDRCAEANPDMDIIKLVPVDKIGNYTNLDEYLDFLQVIRDRVAPMVNSANNLAAPNDDLNRMVNALDDMIKLGRQEYKEDPDRQGYVDELTPATASEELPTKDAVFTPFKPLTTKVPVCYTDRQNLPASYPSHKKIYGVVVSRAEQTDFMLYMHSQLKSAVRDGIQRLADQMANSGYKDFSITQAILELQKYLMEHHWIGYGLADIPEAADFVVTAAQAGVRTDFEPRDGWCYVNLLVTPSIAYAFLGAALDRVLRRGVQKLAADVVANYDIPGGRPGIDCVVFCSSLYIQDMAKDWLKGLTKSFLDAEANG